jgi:hypothetical protein
MVSNVRSSRTNASILPPIIRRQCLNLNGMHMHEFEERRPMTRSEIFFVSVLYIYLFVLIGIMLAAIYISVDASKQYNMIDDLELELEDNYQKYMRCVFNRTDLKTYLSDFARPRIYPGCRMQDTLKNL